MSVSELLLLAGKAVHDSHPRQSRIARLPHDVQVLLQEFRVVVVSSAGTNPDQLRVWRPVDRGDQRVLPVPPSLRDDLVRRVSRHNSDDGDDDDDDDDHDNDNDASSPDLARNPLSSFSVDVASALPPAAPSVADVAALPDGQHVAAVFCGLRQIVVWDVLEGRVVRQCSRLCPPGVEATGLTPLGGDVLLVRFSSGTYTSVWNFRTGGVVRIRPMATVPHVGACRCASTWDAKHIVTGHDDGLLALWNQTTGTIKQAVRAHASAMLALVALPRDAVVITAAEADPLVKLIDVSQPERPQIRHIFDCQAPVLAVALLPSGLLAVATAGAQIVIWDLATGAAVLPVLATPRPIIRLAALSDGRLFGSDGASLWLWASGSLDLIDHFPDSLFGQAFAVSVLMRRR